LTDGRRRNVMNKKILVMLTSVEKYPNLYSAN